MMVQSSTTSTSPGPQPSAMLLGDVASPSGLTASDLDCIAGALDPCWHMARHRDLAGEALAVILPSGNDPSLPSWIVFREGALLRLDVCRDDEYERHGAYPALQSLLASLRPMLDAAGR